MVVEERIDRLDLFPKRFFCWIIVLRNESCAAELTLAELCAKLLF